MRKVVAVLCSGVLLAVGGAPAVASHDSGQGKSQDNNRGPKCPNPAGKTPPACVKFVPPTETCDGADLDIEVPGVVRVCVFLGGSETQQNGL